MVHGAFGGTRQFTGLLPAVTRGRSAVLVDLQGHGRTADRHEPFSYERFADDCAAVLDHLGVGPAAAVGYSMGGGTVLQLAFRHPGSVTRLAVVSAPFRSSGWLPDVMANFRATGSHQWPAVEESPLYRDHAAVAPLPWEPVLVFAQDGQRTEVSAPYRLLVEVGEPGTVAPASPVLGAVLLPPSYSLYHPIRVEWAGALAEVRFRD